METEGTECARKVHSTFKRYGTYNFQSRDILNQYINRLRAVVFIATAAAIYDLGHGLCTFTAVPMQSISTFCGPGHIFGANEARHFKFSLQIKCKGYCHYIY